MVYRIYKGYKGDYQKTSYVGSFETLSKILEKIYSSKKRILDYDIKPESESVYKEEWQLKWKLTIRYLDKSLEDDELEFTDRDLTEKYMQEFNHQESVAYAKLDKC